MDKHTFDSSKADKLEKVENRYRFLSTEELLWAISIKNHEKILDLGSGTGFYTDDIAPYFDKIYAIDIQKEMHEYYINKGKPENVELVTADVENIPFNSNYIEISFSTMTFHEFANNNSLKEINRILKPGGKLVIVDWSGTGKGIDGPPLDKRFKPNEAINHLNKLGFQIKFRAFRPETFMLICKNK